MIILSFMDLDIQIRYRSEIHNFPRDFLIPVLSQAKIYKRGTGYFSTSALVQLSVGLFEMAKNGGKIQLICSPELDKKDVEAIDYGYRTREETISDAIIKGISEPVDFFEEERLNLIATLISEGRLDIKIAFMEEDNGFRLYHEKIAYFEDADGNKISYAGSANESANGLDGNFESIYTFCSWKDSSQIEAVEMAEMDFDNMWANQTSKLHVIPFPKIAVEKLLKYKKSAGVDWDIDVKEYGYNYIEVMPLSEHPCDESWGYQNTGFFSPTSRYGTATDLKCFIDKCHKNNIGVIMDFVPVHFAVDGFALANYDGTPLYEYPHEDVAISQWGSKNFTHSKGEVRSFLQSAANYWIEEYHFDGLRVDALSNIIYWQ